MNKRSISISLPALFILTGLSLLAQRTTGEILGTVRDQTEAVLPGARVTIINMDTGLTRNILTDETGSYHVRLLPVGRYKIEAELTGFKKQEITGLELQVDQVARIDLSMQVGQVSETLEVEAQAPLTKTDSADVGMVIEQKQIRTLPVRGENSFVDLVSLDAGVVKTATYLNSIFTDLFGGQANSYGSPGDGSRFMIDGVDIKDTAYSRINIRISGNAIQEMKAESNSYASEFGQNSGLHVNMITKSGSNDYHGSLFWNIRNSVLNARNFFEPSQKPLSQFNIYGGSIGGPIVKNKTFFFFNYQGTRDRKSVSRLVSVPPVAMRAGDLSSLPQQIFDPATYDPATGRRQPFPGNIIPANRISPVARNILYGTSDGVQPALFPMPDRPGLANNLLGLGKQQQDFDQFVVRVDHKFSDTDSVYGRYIYDRQNRNLRFNRYLHDLPNFTDVWRSPAQNVRVGWTKTLGANKVNEAKLGFDRMTQFLQDEVCCNTPVPARLGIQGTSKLFQYNPWVTIAGFNRAGTLLNAPNNRSDNTYTIGDTFSYNVRSHAIAFGGEWRRREINGGAQPTPNGNFTFSARYTTQPGVANTGFSLADFLLGFPTSAGVGREEVFRNHKQYDLGLFVKDTWKVHPKLTLDLGVRWEYLQAPSEIRGRISQFDPVQGKLVALNGAQMNDPLVSTTPWPEGIRITTTDPNNVAPRIGLAYRPFGGNKTVFRGSYGIAYLGFDLFRMNDLANNRPFVNPLSFVGDPLIPNLTIANPFPEGQGIVSATARGTQRQWIDGYNQQWNFSAERALTDNLVWDIGYIGNRGVHLKVQGNLDLPPPGPGSPQLRRPYPDFTSVAWTQPSGASSYHGLRTNLKQRFTKGFSGEFSYVWSKWLDCGGNGLFADTGDNQRRNPFDCKAEWGRSIYDQRHRVVFNFLYEIPFMRGPDKGVAGAILGNWIIAGIGTFATGGAIDPTIAYDNSNTGSLSDRPDLVSDPNQNAPHTREKWFNTEAFARPPQYTFGNAGRNTITGPGYATFDFSMLKDWKVESWRIQFRTDFFNMTNHTNFDTPNTTAFTPAFGTISNAANSRQIQFGLRIEF
jgi:hypothetical protein